MDRELQLVGDNLKKKKKKMYSSYFRHTNWKLLYQLDFWVITEISAGKLDLNS